MEKEPLLKDLDKLLTKEDVNISQGKGNYPLKRPIEEYLKHGVIILDKPKNPSSHEISTWVKNILKLDKTGHCGTLDPQVSGVLTVCLDRATRLVKCQQHAGKQYVCEIEFAKPISRSLFIKTLKQFTGKLLQRPPLMSAVKRSLRVRNIYKIDFLDIEDKNGLFKVECEAGTYIRTLCEHIGLTLGVEAFMKDLRRIKSGHTKEEECVTMHDLQDAVTEYDNTKNEIPLRKVVRPLEYLLKEYKRIIIKDSAVEAICNGAKLSVKGIIKYDPDLKEGTEVVLVSTKGEAIALVKMKISSQEIEIYEGGLVADIIRVIMEKGVYDKYWKNKLDYDIYSSEDDVNFQSNLNYTVEK